MRQMGEDFAIVDTKFVKLTLEKLTSTTVDRWLLGRLLVDVPLNEGYVAEDRPQPDAIPFFAAG